MNENPVLPPPDEYNEEAYKQRRRKQYVGRLAEMMFIAYRAQATGMMTPLGPVVMANCFRDAEMFLAELERRSIEPP